MKVRVGFIGLGGMAQGHISVLSGLDDVEITGVYDVNMAHAQKIAESLDAQIYGSSDELIESGKMDALFICSPQFARDDAEVKAAQRGIHLFVEKPLGLELPEIIAKEQKISESGVIHSSGYCMRYLDIVQKAKHYLYDKQVDMVLGYRMGGFHIPAWWRQQHLSGGQLVDQTTHQVDLIRYLAGEIDEVYAQFALRSLREDDPEATIYDVGTLALRLESGAVGNVSNSCLLPRSSRSEVEITGRHFHVQINGFTLRIVDENQDMMEVSRMDYYQEQDKQFIEAVRSQSQELILGSYTEALKTLAVTLAANESALLRKPMKRMSGTCLFE